MPALRSALAPVTYALGVEVRSCGARDWAALPDDVWLGLLDEWPSEVRERVETGLAAGDEVRGARGSVFWYRRRAG